MDNATPVFITSDFDCEVGITALARFLLPEGCAAYLNVPAQTLSDPAAVKNELLPKLRARPSGRIAIHLFGDFWSKCEMAETLGAAPDLAEIYVYQFDGQSFRHQAGRWVPVPSPAPAGDNYGIVVAVAKTIRTPSAAIEFALTRHAELLCLLNDRSLGQNADGTHPLFAGLWESKAQDAAGLEATIYLLLTGQLEYDKILEIGNTVFRNHRNLARARALKNARSGKLAGGASYVVTDAPELINLTHSELKKEYPSAQVTICAKLSFKNGADDHVRHSLRSWDPKIDVKIVIGERGGGSGTAAGCSSRVNVGLDY